MEGNTSNFLSRTRSKNSGQQEDETKCGKCGRPQKVLRQCFSEYSSKSTIHGVKYLGEENRPVYEKIFWILVFAVSIYCCLVIIVDVWRKWNETPVLVTFNEKNVELWTIPFPSVTICSDYKSNSSIFRYGAVHKNLNPLTESEKKYYSALSHVCLSRQFTSASNGSNILDTLDELFVEYIFICKWRNVDYDCLIKKVVTEEGICYNFNGLDILDMYHEHSIPDFSNKDLGIGTNWNRYDGYREVLFTEEDKDYPRRAVSGKMGLELIMAVRKKDKDVFCMPSAGFKVKKWTK